MTDSFSFECTLNNPLTEEDWNKISDAEFEKTTSVTFKTPQGKEVKYIKSETLDMIRAEIEEASLNGGRFGLRKALDIIDKYKEENVKYESAYRKGYIDATRDFRKETSRDMEEIKEVMNCDTDAEAKCRMISDILNAKPHYFK